jgi:hypothetical protein
MSEATAAGRGEADQWALDRFDWLMYLSTFVMEECKHAEFFTQ